MKTKNILGLCGAAALVLATSAQAITTDSIRVSFDGGSSWVTADDGNAVVDATHTADFNPTANVISAVFLNGALTISLNGSGNGTGVGSPFMDLGIGGSMAPGTSVIVEFSANGFTPPSTGTYLTTQTVNGSGYTVTETTRIGTGATGNNLFATGGALPSIGPISAPSGVATTSSGTAPAGTSDPYSITVSEVITVAALNPDQTRNTTPGSLSIDTTVKVPDGGNTMVLLGSALSVLGGLGLFRKKAVKA